MAETRASENQEIEDYCDDPLKAAEIFGVEKARKMYEEAIYKADTSDRKKELCLKYIELEKSLQEWQRVRNIFTFASRLSNPREEPDFWIQWLEFEEQYGTHWTCCEMSRMHHYRIMKSLSKSERERLAAIIRDRNSDD